MSIDPSTHNNNTNSTSHATLVAQTQPTTQHDLSTHEPVALEALQDLRLNDNDDEDEANEPKERFSKLKKRTASNATNGTKGKGRDLELSPGGNKHKASSAASSIESRSSDDDESDSSPKHSALLATPPEILIRILSFLDPVSLATSGRVCRSLARLVRDDSTWRLAFTLNFGIEDLRVVPALRRLETSSWKMEYARRFELLRRWRKSRAPTVLSDPRISTLHGFALSLQHSFLITVSRTHGVAVRSNPFSGKLALGFLDATGGIVAHAAHVPARISAVALDADATRIIWGSQQGELTQTTLTRQGSKPRALIRSMGFSPRGAHTGPILSIAPAVSADRGGSRGAGRAPERLRQRQAALGAAAQTFVSAGADGTVKLWSPTHAMPLWSAPLRKPQESVDGTPPPRPREPPSPCVCVEFDAGTGTIAAADAEGRIVLWTGIDLAALLLLPASAFEAATAIATPAQALARADLADLLVSIHRLEIARPASAGKELGTLRELVLDPRAGPEDGSRSYSLLAHFAGSACFYRHDIVFAEQGVEISTITFKAEGEAKLTCVRPDFDVINQRSSSRNGAVVATPSISPRVTAIRKGGSASPPPFVLGPPVETRGESRLSERACIWAGSEDGKLYVWDWAATPSVPGGACAPSSTLAAHHCDITAIDANAHAVVVGAADGAIKAFCPLSGALLRTFNDRAATRHSARALAAGEMTSEEAERYAVHQLALGPDTLVAAIGPHTLAWRAGPLVRGGKRAAAAASAAESARAARGARVREGKFEARVDLRDDLRETTAALRVEHEEAQEAYERMRYSTNAAAESGLSEQEALEYALMLSRDEADASRGDDSLEGALRQIASAEDRSAASSSKQRRQSHGDVLDSHDEDIDSSFDVDAELTDDLSPSPSPRTSPAFAPITSPSRAWDIIAASGTRSTRASPSLAARTPNAKVQTVSVPRSARTASASHESSGGAFVANEEIPPIGSPSDWPCARSPASASPGLAAWRLNATTEGASSRSPGAGAWVGSPSRSNAHSPRGAWAGGSPALRPTLPDSSSSSSGSLSARGGAGVGPSSASPQSWQTNAAEMDDDLRFAIELSLAEERSRRELNGA